MGNDRRGEVDRINRSYDDVLARHPNQQSAEYVSEMEQILQDLSALLLPPAPDSALEAKILCDRSSAFFDLSRAYTRASPSRCEELLLQSAEGYKRAEALLDEASSGLQLAKLNFNFGNTLRSLSQGEDTRLLEMAEERYEKAVRGFQVHAPEHLAFAEEILKSIEPQIQLSRLKGQVGAAHDRFAAIRDRISLSGLKDDAAIRKRFGAEVERARREAIDPATVSAEAASAISEALESLTTAGESDEQRLGAAAQALTEIADRSSSSSSDGPMPVMMKMLADRLERDISEGKVAEPRQETLRQLVGRLEELVARPDETIADLQGFRETLEDLLRRAATLEASRLPDNPRARKIHLSLSALVKNLGMDSLVNRGGELDGRRQHELLMELSEHYEPLSAEEMDEDRCLTREAEQIRGAVLAAKQHLRRRRLMVARPFWGAVREPIDPQAVFFSGGTEVRQLAQRVCRRLRLDLQKVPRAGELAERRWRDLVTCHVALFDLQSRTEIEAAGVYYDLGLAKALGKPVVLLTSSEDGLPFNIDDIALTGESARDLDAVSAALDQALYSSELDASDSTPAAAIVAARRMLPASTAEHDVLWRQLDEEPEDAVLARQHLEFLFKDVGGERPMLFLPAWAPVYPEGFRCFHITGFGRTPEQREAFDEVREWFRERCDEIDLSYRRGDEVPDPDVIESIWSEISRSACTIVDLSTANANAFFECGLSHALGRPTVLITRDRSPDGAPLMPRMLAKQRIHIYEPGHLTRDLGTPFTRFLEGIERPRADTHSG